MKKATKKPVSKSAKKRPNPQQFVMSSVLYMTIIIAVLAIVLLAAMGFDG